MTVGWDVDPVVAAWPGRPALTERLTADACVIGLGGSGLAAVEDLVNRGLSVVGLDAGRVAAGAAGRNGGFLLGGGAPSLPEAQRRWGVEPAVELYRATLAEIDGFAARFGPDVIRRVGSIRLIVDEDERDDCAEQRAAMLAAGLAVEDYDGPLGEGLYFPADAATNPARRVLAMAATLTGRARLFEHSPVRSITAGEISTDAGSVAAGLVIVAVDGGLDVLLPQLSSLVRTARLQMLATAPVSPGRLPCPVYARWGYDYAQQDGSGRILAGGGRDRFAAREWTTADATTQPVQDWIERVAARAAGAPITVTHRWAASVGYTADARALCIPVAERIVACGGYCGTGNLVGAIAARAAVALAVDGTPPPPYFRSTP